ncbi:hypothetical protein L1049_002071 [Liquidambar formosana]|uniref:DYW domain-containing protein n=1 Tax=Liquidambar formosana TaxID=63359 RepID=A0AAP0R8M9_LIQFO
MVSTRMKPNEVTFARLIYAYSHHYTCLLDLLSRSRHLREAEDVIKTMPFKFDKATWAVLLSACKRHGNTQMGICIANHLLGLRPEDPSTYILLSNAYASAAREGNATFWHIKRVAVAYGLLKAVPRIVILIVKNLRVYGDCHTVLKFISSIVKREIVVREANRFIIFRIGYVHAAIFSDFDFLFGNLSLFLHMSPLY